MRSALSVVFALTAAALFGVSTVLQHSAAQRAVDAPLLRLALLRRLARQPRWVAAVALSAVSFGVQALALVFGPLTLVQPIAATDLLFALPLLARRRRYRLRALDGVGAGLVAGGVGSFLALAPPSSGRMPNDLTDWLWVLAVVAVVVGVLAPAALRARPAIRTGLLAAAAAVLFALLDALTKSFVLLIGADGVGSLAHWEPYGLLVAATTGMVLSQSAFRSGPLLISLPIIDSVEPIGAVLIGVTVFGEHIARSPGLLAAQVLAGAVAVAGIVVLDRSPLIAPPPGAPPPVGSPPAAPPPGPGGPSVSARRRGSPADSGVGRADDRAGGRAWRAGGRARSAEAGGAGAGRS